MKLDYLELQKLFQSPILKPKTSSKILSVKNLKQLNPFMLAEDNTTPLVEIGWQTRFLEELNLKVELWVSTMLKFWD